MRPLFAILVSAWLFGVVSLAASVVRAEGTLDAGPVTNDLSIAEPAPLPDPIKEPAKAVAAIRDNTKEHGIAAGIVLALSMLAGLLVRYSRPGSLLDRGRLPVIFAAAAGVLTVLAAVLAHELPWSAMLPALVTGVAAVWNPIPVKPPL